MHRLLAAADDATGDLVAILGTATAAVAVAIIGYAVWRVRRSALDGGERSLLDGMRMTAQAQDLKQKAKRKQRELAEDPHVDQGWLGLLADKAEVTAKQVDEHLQRQHAALTRARTSFWASTLAGAIGLVLVFLGLFLAIDDVPDQGLVTALAGAVPATLAGLLYLLSALAAREAADQFEKLCVNVRRTELIRETLRLSTQLADPWRRERVHAVVALQTVFPDASPAEVIRLLGEHHDDAPTPPPPRPAEPEPETSLELSDREPAG
ncbi:hypothetical protein SAMN04489726_4321 [Allokutzneria albata]|uniref:Cyanobacterial TRADD-N associated 2 transmembrane domain-containing protein n=1 Tax=Allokutzneria albata TaxID=211114 RepID=A0A1G9XQ74_ALLAB|nr:hypothetical protein SAMN04489726_4321 [Allokutzneria albata]